MMVMRFLAYDGGRLGTMRNITRYNGCMIKNTISLPVSIEHSTTSQMIGIVFPP
jgi:hypothetical protein